MYDKRKTCQTSKLYAIERLTAWDNITIDPNTPLPIETNNDWLQHEHVVFFSTCIGLLAVFGMMVCVCAVIAGQYQCSPEKNKMRYVSMLLKSCVDRHCRSNGSGVDWESEKHRSSENTQFIECSLQETSRSCFNGFNLGRTSSSRRHFGPSKVYVLSDLAMSEADDMCDPSDSFDMTESDMDNLDPFPDTRLSEVVAKMLDIDSDGSDAVSDDNDDDEHVTAFINYNEEPRNKGLFREPLKPIKEEDDNLSQTESMGKTTPVDVNTINICNHRDTFDSMDLPLRPVVKAKSVETVFDVYPTTTTTTECTFVAKDAESTSTTQLRHSKFRWSVTSV